MISVVNNNKRCAHDGCPLTVNYNNTNDGYCLRCFIHLFPEKKVARGYKIKETHVVDVIKTLDNPHNYEMTFDKRTGGCSARRPDILIDCLTHTVIIECDEEQHDSDDYCSCENKRMMQLFCDLANRPLILIRFNPDSYINASGKKVASCFKYHKQVGIPIIRNATEWKRRTQVLTERIRHHTRPSAVPSREITIEHLYYDGFH